MRLPPLKFQIPEWRPDQFAPLEKNKKKIADLLKKTGKGSDKFINACARIMKLAIEGRADKIPGIIVSPVDVRALTYLFGQREFRDHAPITREMLVSLHNPRPKLSLISLFQMINAFFLYFDRIGSQEIFDNVCRLLRDELENRRNDKSGHDIAIMSRNKDMLFVPDGPRRVVDYATNRKIDLDAVLKELCLQNYADTRFHRLCRYQYYLETLRQLPVGRGNAIFAEVCKADVYNAPAGEGRLLGHEIISILIDRTWESGQTISDEWRAVILTIAGDPRIPAASPRFQKWWAILGEIRQRRMKEWLSGFDLRLFLEALNNYGISAGNIALQRMFKARKTFLEGLLEQKLIQHARLFVGRSPERYLRGCYQKDELPEYATVNDTYRSMIYLQVGHCHMIEGSHNFRLWLFPKLPASTGITQYSKRNFLPDDLSSGLEKLYRDEFGPSAKKPIAVKHYPDLAWQAAAIKYLQGEGVILDIERLLEPGSYKQYKYRYGLS